MSYYILDGKVCLQDLVSNVYHQITPISIIKEQFYTTCAWTDKQNTHLQFTFCIQLQYNLVVGWVILLTCFLK